MPKFLGTCNVHVAGPCTSPDLISIQLGEAVATLEGEAFPDWRWFTAPPGKEREFLATALAAISAGKKVLAGMDDIVNWGQLKSLYLLDAPSS